jgi:Mg-chelatase subunit ChlD
MTGSEPDEAFDLWDEGREDAVDIEAVILLDNSGSMHWAMESASNSMWAIKRSLDKVNASTTVVTFADDARLLYSASEKAKVTKKYSGTDGGTNVNQAIAYAKYVFANSTRAIKLLIVITDGEWYDSGFGDKTIAQLNKAGVITALGYIDNNIKYGMEPTAKITGHNAQIVVPLSDASGLLGLAKALVKLGIKRNLAK